MLSIKPCGGKATMPVREATTASQRHCPASCTRSVTAPLYAAMPNTTTHRMLPWPTPWRTGRHALCRQGRNTPMLGRPLAHRLASALQRDGTEQYCLREVRLYSDQSVTREMGGRQEKRDFFTTDMWVLYNKVDKAFLNMLEHTLKKMMEHISLIVYNYVFSISFVRF